MKNIVLTVAAAAVTGALAQPAAAQSTTYGDVAKVLSATPIQERVTSPRRDCRPEQVTMYEERRAVRLAPEGSAPSEPGIGPGTILGAIVGGVIGHQFGNSTGGRDHGTVAGALIGGLVGNAADRDAQAGYQAASRDVIVDRVPVTREVQRCSDVADSRDVIVGYDVRYEYNGREFRTRLPHDPGPEMPVNVEVRPPLPRAAYDAPRTPRYRGPY
jgi:uncharacterized protein YcfJ